MTKYRVEFLQHVTTSDRMAAIVEASSPEEAGQKIQRWGKNNGDLNDEEESSISTVKEGDVVSSVFFSLAGAGSIIPVVEEIDSSEFDKQVYVEALLRMSVPLDMAEELETLRWGYYMEPPNNRWVWSPTAVDKSNLSLLKNVYIRIKQSQEQRR